jgi:CPA1 family monovalent cation:H+ antiporter
MQTFDLFAILIVLAAAFSYINLRVLKLPAAIGLMALSLISSLAVVVLGQFLPHFGEQATKFVTGLDFHETLLHGMLGFLLFAGALHVDLTDLNKQRLPIAILATFGVLISTAIVGVLTWLVLNGLGLKIRMIDSLLFGALISPTDPITVLALLKRIGCPVALEVQIAGESLFNDGVGVVVFSAILGIAMGVESPDAGHISVLFLREAVGGTLFGLVLGVLVFRLLRSVDDYPVEIMLTLALVAGGYTLADALHLSGPIAIVVAGLVIGNHGRQFAMSEKTRHHIDMFWEFMDETLNAILFVLIGLEVMVIKFSPRSLLGSGLVIMIVLFARFVSVGLPIRFLRNWMRLNPKTTAILTWGGLRGGISVALALAIPGPGSDTPLPAREIILTTTYAVVVFSILVQGLSIGPLAKRWLALTESDPGPANTERSDSHS